MLNILIKGQCWMILLDTICSFSILPLMCIIQENSIIVYSLIIVEINIKSENVQ